MMELIAQLMFLSVPAYFIAQVYTLIKWKGGWRVASIIPAILMSGVLIYTVYAFIQESNLWPLVLIFVSPVAVGYLFLLALIKKLAGARSGPAPKS